MAHNLAAYFVVAGCLALAAVVVLIDVVAQVHSHTSYMVLAATKTARANSEIAMSLIIFALLLCPVLGLVSFPELKGIKAFLDLYPFTIFILLNFNKFAAFDPIQSFALISR